MNIDHTVTALMFPAIPLLMGVYSNRFHTLSALIRKIHDAHVFEKHTPPEWKAQFINLNRRISLLKFSMVFAAFGFLFNMLTVFDEWILGNIKLIGSNLITDRQKLFQMIPFILKLHTMRTTWTMIQSDNW